MTRIRFVAVVLLILAMAMFADYPLTAREWTACFRYKVGGGSGSGSDGFALMCYKNQSSYHAAILGYGGALGFQHYRTPYMRLIAGYGITFDDWLNSDASDPSPAHIALLKNSVRHHLAYRNDFRTGDNH
jgi:hypothetical protein